MQMSLQSNMRAVERDLSDVARRQLPFATSLALNATVDEIQKNEARRLDKVLDRPTPFTRKAFAVRRSTKRRQEARVYAKRIQAGYLITQEEGGKRLPARRAIVIPQKLRRNKYGNMAKGAMRRLSARTDVFSGQPKGHARAPGLYQRKGKKLVKQVSYVDKATYRPRLKFRSSAEKTARRRFPVHLERALKRAFATRRR